MIKQDDNVTYILTKTNLTLAIGTYKYKICANHDWAENYGDDNDSEGNASVLLQETESTTSLSPSILIHTRFPAYRPEKQMP